jgi:general stress protein 26
VNLAGLLQYVRDRGDGVVSTIDADGVPQGAYVAVTATDRSELVFNARQNSRKVANIRRNQRAALTIGGHDGTTLQCQGIADLPGDLELDRCATAYYKAFPQFTRSSGGDIVFVRVRLEWARYGRFVGDHFESEDVDVNL